MAPLDPAPPHNHNLDLLRVVACLAVVMLHTSARTVYLYGEVSNLTWNIANLINSSTRWCVPVFVMISGALIAVRPITDPAAFIKRRADTILVPIVFWTIAYLLWRAIRIGDELTVLFALKLVFSGSPYYHLYFLFVIAGLYAVAPVIAAAIKALPRGFTIGLSLAALAVELITLTVQGLSSNALTSFIPYVGYFALGAMLIDTRLSLRWPSIILALSVCATAALTFVAISRTGIGSEWAFYFYNYFGPTVLVMAPTVFCLFVNMHVPEAVTRMIRPIVPLTLGIYLIHPMVLQSVRWLWAHIAPALLNPAIDVPVTFIFTITLSAVAIAIVRRIPFVRRIV